MNNQLPVIILVDSENDDDDDDDIQILIPKQENIASSSSSSSYPIEDEVTILLDEGSSFPLVSDEELARRLHEEELDQLHQAARHRLEVLENEPLPSSSWTPSFTSPIFLPPSQHPPHLLVPGSVFLPFQEHHIPSLSPPSPPLHRAPPSTCDDAELARLLAAEEEEEEAQARRSQALLLPASPPAANSSELLDPTPDAFALFNLYNRKYFDNKLDSVAIGWSKRMTLCAGICRYEGRGGLCEIRLSEPLLKFRSRNDVISTLLHEMIHAYLFVTERNTDRDGHGPRFLQEASRLNAAEGSNITVFHSFHDEVNLYRTHWWQCQGKCRRIIRRAMNRAPAPHDPWWGMHQRQCGGGFLKIKEPPKASGKRTAKTHPTQPSLPNKSQRTTNPSNSNNNNNITSYFVPNDQLVSTSTSSSSSSSSSSSTQQPISSQTSTSTQTSSFKTKSNHISNDFPGKGRLVNPRLK